MKLLFIILLLSESAFGLTTTAIAAITASNASIVLSNAAAVSARRRRERECREEFMSKSCPPVPQEVLNYNGKFYEEPKLYMKLEFK